MSNVIRGLRTLRGLTQEEVANKIGMGVRTFSTKENNPNAFTVEEIKRLAKVLEVEETIFFKDKLTVTVS